MKPLFSYPGQKAWLAPKMLELFPDIYDRMLVELFGGSSALSFALEHKSVVYNEALEPLANLMLAAQVDPVYLSEYASLKFNPDPEANFYQHRSLFNQLQSENNSDWLVKSGHLLHVARRGFNSTLRFNKSGLNNTPYRKVPKPVELPKADELKAYSELIKGWTISNQLADNVLEAQEFEANAVVFADPPYAGTATTYGTDWKPDDTIALLNMLDGNAETFLVTLEPNQLYADYALEAGWQVELIVSGRKYQQKTGGQKPLELLIYRK